MRARTLRQRATEMEDMATATRAESKAVTQRANDIRQAMEKAEQTARLKAMAERKRRELEELTQE